VSEVLQNPRRSPRAPVRCSATVISASGSFDATTEDIGAFGCQLVSPRLIRKGEPVQLVVSHEEGKERLRVSGRVAWASEQQPWRLGIAYDHSVLGQSKKWFDDLLARDPVLGGFRRVPDRIPVEAAVYLATPPRFLVDFNAEEVALLRSIGSGASVAELRALLRDRWPAAQRALFSLLAHQHVTLSRGGSVHPDAWRKILSEAEASLAIESLRATGPIPDAPPPPAPVASPARSAAAPAAVPAVAALSLEPPPAVGGAAEPEASGNWLVTAADMVPASWPTAAVPVATPVPGGTRAEARGLDAHWAATPPPAIPDPAAARGRTDQAQDLFRGALGELEAGRFPAAMALLRRALTLAPGDPEIAAALGRAMRGGR
jgi:hypothetical protein